MCSYSHFTDQSLTPSAESGSTRRQEQKKPLGVFWGQAWEDLSQGLLFFLTGVSDHLQEVQLPLIPLHLCQLLYGHTSYLLPDMMCAGDLRNGKTPCEVCPTTGTVDQVCGFHVFICFEPPGALLSGWVVPQGLAPEGVGSTSP